MYNGGKIIVGLIVFIAFFTFPFYYNLGSTITKPEPKLNTPVIEQLAEKKCVESKDFMRTEHMQLLNQWRDSVVRDGNRLYVNTQGKQITMSLQLTCLKCHSNKKDFCDTCHNYLGVHPYCFSCHIAPEEKP